jgi:hypothetical protein
MPVHDYQWYIQTKEIRLNDSIWEHSPFIPISITDSKGKHFTFQLVTFEPVRIVLKQRDHAKNKEGRTQANFLTRPGHGRSKGHKYKSTT